MRNLPFDFTQNNEQCEARSLVNDVIQLRSEKIINWRMTYQPG
jgi:hypothetical protein